MKQLLITGITGLIGKSVLNKLLETTDAFEITAIVRPATNLNRYEQYKDKIKIEYIDLADIDNLKALLQKNVYDIILHIGALRGGRKASKKAYYKSNVNSTEQFVEHALLNKSRLIFCSSVGVFGAIPDEMPANNETPYKEDNYYHYTKIVCEKLINRAILNGLNAVIVRPSITYGVGDFGFPYQLVRLVKYRILPLSNKNIWIHLCNIDTITAAFVQLATNKTDITGKAFNIADAEPIQLRDVVNFIYRQLYDKNYPPHLVIDNKLLILGEKVARLIRNELWTSRFELISHSWFYQVSDAYELLDLPTHYTIPDFKIVINDYLKKK
jgi:nucleoside-diphosphate-sugar epimerase